MEVTLLREPAVAVDTDVLIVLATEDTAAPPQLGAAGADGLIARLYASGEFTGGAGEHVLLHAPAGVAAPRLLLVGCGKPAELSPDAIRKATGVAVRQIRSKAVRRAACVVPAPGSDAFLAAAVEGAILGDYEPDFLKSVDSSRDKRLNSFSAIAPSSATGSAEAAIARGIIVAESQNFARDLGNEPANVLNPTELASRARLMANQEGLEIEIIEQDRLVQLGMGSLLGVAKGSAQPPVLVIVRYRPAEENRAKTSQASHLGLVGKGVTFDSGGISIKPAEGMEKMKYDMCGAAAVLGAMRAIARLKPSIEVTALVPAVENMTGAAAQRPGDIVKSLSGKTIEVLNTDAEGRLILNDAITYAQRLGCTHLVDAATLTGAIVVALGHLYTGAFTNDQPMMDRVLASARATGEKLWQMPLDAEYKELLKNAYADLSNIGGRWGGAISAAYFLKEFADPTPWVHLDIAGTAWLDEAKPHLAKGPTGVGVRTFVDLALSW
ncbi:MAG: leucyl aminopeptidase [Bryobacterales bacterium]|nr:leucyl aminopeptidase [Bryobacterales bacterium]